MRNKVLHIVKEGRDILPPLIRRKVNWNGYFLPRNCLIKHVTEGKIEGRVVVTGRRGRSRK